MRGVRGARRRGLEIAVAAVFLLEALVVLAFSAVVDALIVDDPPTTYDQLSFASNTGARVNPHFHWLQAGIYIGCLTVSFAVLVFSAVVILAWRRADERPAPRATRLAPACAALLLIAITCEAYVALGDAHTTPLHRAIPVVVFGLGALAGLVVLCYRPLQTRPVPFLAALAAAALLVALFAGDGDADVHGFEHEQSLPAVTVPGSFAAAQGFWTDTVTQTPTQALVLRATCGDPEHCVVVGSGHLRTAGVLHADLVVTANGGRSWHTWVLPPPLTVLDAYLAPPTCHGATCLLELLSPGGDLYRFTILSDGSVRGRLLRVRGGGVVPPMSCPTPTWCDAVSVGGHDGARSFFAAFAAPSFTRTDEPIPGFPSTARSFSPKATAACADPTTCVLDVRTVPEDGQPEKATLYDTTDGGVHWQPASIVPAPPPGAVLSTFVCTPSLLCTAHLSGDGADSLAQSGDGGALWHPATLPDVPGVASWDGLDCVSATDCLDAGESAGGTFVVEVTTDAGARWSALRAAQLAHVSNDVSFCATLTWCLGGGVRFRHAVIDHRRVSEHTPVVVVLTDRGTRRTVLGVPAPRPAGARAGRS